MLPPLKLSRISYCYVLLIERVIKLVRLVMVPVVTVIHRPNVFFAEWRPLFAVNDLKARHPDSMSTN